MNLNIPLEFREMNSMPYDPPNSVAFGKQTQMSNCFMMIYPIESNASMPYGNEREVIDGIHEALSDNQGLIEVKSGMTKNQKRYIYSIVKTKLEPSGIQYVLTMHIDMIDYTINIQSFFDEIGMTGFRDTTIMNKLINEGKINESNMDSWFKDPYDANYKKGLPMNLSEQLEYDVFFPEHPLSETRSFIKYVIDNN